MGEKSGKMGAPFGGEGRRNHDTNRCETEFLRSMLVSPGLAFSQLQVHATWKLVIRKLDRDQRVNFHRKSHGPSDGWRWQELSDSQEGQVSRLLKCPNRTAALRARGPKPGRQKSQ